MSVIEIQISLFLIVDISRYEIEISLFKIYLYLKCIYPYFKYRHLCLH